MSLLPIMAVELVKLAEANALLTEWDHPLDACNRPFGSMSHVLFIEGAAVAVTVAASTVSATVERYKRKQVVELARIARSPEHPWAMRPMLRLWRADLAHRWPYRNWSIDAAVSYSLPGTKGDIYRFDGWRFVKFTKPSSPGKGSTWAKPSASDAIGDGIKGLWIYDYQPIEAVA
ncbi:MAG: hypothetical protein SHS37scaffold145_47 [Phage 71_18]|nr:MAG: hypothetical protein SHS37scaffold145_47 [Phage 71_18]